MAAKKAPGPSVKLRTGRLWGKGQDPWQATSAQPSGIQAESVFRF